MVTMSVPAGTSEVGTAVEAVHLIVTCSNRKTSQVPDRLRLGNVHEKRPGHRFTAWTNRLAAPGKAARPAADLYAGEHWQVARTLPAVGLPRRVNLWVCSAGYGLIRASVPIQPYAATFTPGMADSVGVDRAAARDWWNRLAEWPGPEPDQPRSFTDLARQDPHSTVIAVLSDAYQRVCAPDINDAAAHLHDPQQLSVIGPANGELGDVVVPVTARLQAGLGGSLLSLNVRVAAYLLRTSVSCAEALKRHQMQRRLQEAMSAAPSATPRPVGRRLTDEEIRTFIRGELAQDRATATALLRRLRKGGESCEQARFAQLFAQVASLRGDG